MKTGRLVLAILLTTTAAALAQDRFDSAPQQQRPQQPAQQQQQQQQPQQQQQQQQAPGARPGPPAQLTVNAANANAETRDLGVSPTDKLHAGPMHGPTPNSIPGARVITTPALADMLKTNGQRVRIFDVLGSNERLPNALNAVPAHQAGSFDDAVQGEFGKFLQQVTQGQQDTPLVFYCQSTMCWMSYNAALRARALGYRNVLWYRGGVEAWKAAGLPLQGAPSR